MVWLNVDPANKTCTLHSTLECQFTAGRGITEATCAGAALTKKGGWISFPALDQAKAYCVKEFPGYGVTVCC